MSFLPSNLITKTSILQISLNNNTPITYNLHNEEEFECYKKCLIDRDFI